MREITPFERWMRNQVKKQKNIDDQEMLDEMLLDLKKKNEAKKQQQIDELDKKLKIIKT